MFTRYRGIVILSITALVVGAVVLLQARRVPSAPLMLSTATPAPGPTGTAASLLVYVTGAVERPDVYPLPPGSIVKDAILAAGGAAPDADLERINLAATLLSGQQVTVPRQGEPASPLLPLRGESGVGALINVNTADTALLESLPGIGPALAKNIVEHREANGPFRSVEDLVAVPGIGPVTLEKFRDLITVQ